MKNKSTLAKLNAKYRFALKLIKKDFNLSFVEIDKKWKEECIKKQKMENN